jgi:hypothetical protein
MSRTDIAELDWNDARIDHALVMIEEACGVLVDIMDHGTGEMFDEASAACEALDKLIARLKKLRKRI